MRTKRLKSEKGFTIVELMIALSVLSIILLMGTLVIIQIGKLYTKGVNQANLQNSTRNLMNDISSAIQFSGDPISLSPPSGPGTFGAICVGGVRYSYLLNRKLGTDNGYSPAVTTNHVLWRDSGFSGACTPNTTFSSSSGYEMMPVNSRLTNLSVQETPAGSGIWKVSVWSAFGDNDLIAVDGSGSPTCQGVSGSQFCAISILNSSVSRRIE